MTRTEIWLRLMHVSELYGDAMLSIANLLIQQRQIDKTLLQNAGLTSRQAERFLTVPQKALDDAQHWLEQPHHHLILAGSARYPAQLNAIADYPGAFFVAGDPECLQNFQLGVVGSRTPSWYGERWGRLFCESLAVKGVTITSGLARGVDGVAHKAALNANGKSVAVLGNGLGSIHPRRHTRLAEGLIDAGGALVSEFPLTTLPLPHHFPRRNRIISGLSKGVLVVEAALRSGSLVTARCALEQGRDVFALPGPIGSPGSEGPHWLIKQGATLVTAPEDILENLQYGLHWLPDEAENSLYSPDQEVAALPFPMLLANVGDEVTPVDVVAERAGQPVPEVVAQLLELELAGWIAAVPGGYVRLRRASHVRRTNVFV
ncbi:DNA-protecting protein DprA [Citrobacter koseri]|uniref:DNA-protecting protein DprA n=1 Tax=Citrobacter koseri TaxID=545 RepID=UPI00190096A2|nr:DNA-protecting protein DprA [Citrobacter koseri]EKU0540967.1 DNA-protecting protein DprA [Citrobacter koseri]EKU8896944.1 DNA-protecting protein DprA [Citrobacter koseri]MBJ9819435.1 DNA-protecting protein DprA [Citrobacter koseri]MDT7453487.1 DNA-protecting protein DprA [Citrobacter koseri]HBK3303249.1 DNA-protecting protein DprA [Citrobacter koseri]